MAEHIYNIVSEIFVIMMISMISHYVFLEPKWKKWQYYCNGAFLILMIAGELFIESEERMLFSLLCAGANISLARNRHRIRGFFLVLPIMGICVGIIMPLIFLPVRFFEVREDIYENLIDIATFLIILLFVWKGRSWREKFEMELQYRRLQKWESRLLILVGLILFWLMVPLDDIKSIHGLNEDLKTYVILSSISAMILTITVVVLVMQGNKRAYYENIAALNESYLNAEVKHFQVYQETQTETRRVRHDMKNHLHAMLYLAKEERYHELEQYLENLSSSVEQIDMELHCGNALADAICNEKKQLAVRCGISFGIDGRMPENVKIEPVDICTIFSNALDNAIEALEKSDKDKGKRWIRLAISCQGDIIFLHFTNPVYGIKKENRDSKTTKTDKMNHGFGLQNIRLSAEKYHGEIHTEICAGEKEDIFSLEVMLLNE